MLSFCVKLYISSVLIKSSHLVYIVVTVQDSNGDAVENLGLTVPWTCNVSIAKSSSARCVSIASNFSTVSIDLSVS